MTSLTAPLNFRALLRSAPSGFFDSVPFFDAVLIALFLTLNVSTFVLAPGSRIDLPRSGSLQPLPGRGVAVLTVERNGLLFFAGKKVTVSGLEDHFSRFVLEKQTSALAAAKESLTLLVKADKTIPAADLFMIMDKARQAGFAHVHLSAEPVDRYEKGSSSRQGGRGP